MPADLLEKPAEVEDACRETSGVKPVTRPISKTGKQGPEIRQPIETLGEKIFKGHEEFLGWTPD